MRLNEAYSTCNTSLQGSERSLNVGTAAYDNTPVEQLLQGKKYRQEAIEAQFDHTDPHLTGQPSGPVELQRESLRQRNNSVNDNDLRSTVAHTYIAPEHIERKHSNLTPHQPRRSFYNNNSELARQKKPQQQTNKHITSPRPWAGTPSPPRPRDPATPPTRAAHRATTHAPQPAPPTARRTAHRLRATAANRATATSNTYTASCASYGASSYTMRADTRTKSSLR